MTGFFDEPRPSGTNRHAEQTDCPTCGGDRLVPTDPDNPHGAYMRCPDCNPAPTAAREPVEDARWRTYDR